MSRLLLVAACGFTATSATANDWNFTITLSSANGGASTLLTWERTGDVYFAPLTSDPNITATRGTSIYARPGQAVIGTDAIPSLGYYVTHDVSATGLYFKNYTKDIILGVDQFAFGSGGNPANKFSLIEVTTLSGTVTGLNPNGWLPYSVGDSWGFVGDATGSVTLNQDFSVFQVGRWEDPVNGGLTTVIIAGAAVPEPSTYGLILGGLALAGAAIRRRRAK